MIFTKEDVCTSDEQVEKLTREFNIHYRACIGSLIYLLYTRLDLSFALQKLAKFSENAGKVHFEGLIHLLRYIRDNKTLGLKYYADLNDASVTDLLRQANIKTKNHLTCEILGICTLVHVSKNFSIEGSFRCRRNPDRKSVCN